MSGRHRRRPRRTRDVSIPLTKEEQQRIKLIKLVKLTIKNNRINIRDVDDEIFKKNKAKIIDIIASFEGVGYKYFDELEGIIDNMRREYKRGSIEIDDDKKFEDYKDEKRNIIGIDIRNIVKESVPYYDYGDTPSISLNLNYNESIQYEGNKNFDDMMIILENMINGNCFILFNQYLELSKNIPDNTLHKLMNILKEIFDTNKESYPDYGIRKNLYFFLKTPDNKNMIINDEKQKNILKCLPAFKLSDGLITYLINKFMNEGKMINVLTILDGISKYREDSKNIRELLPQDNKKFQQLCSRIIHLTYGKLAEKFEKIRNICFQGLPPEYSKEDLPPPYKSPPSYI